VWLQSRVSLFAVVDNVKEGTHVRVIARCLIAKIYQCQACARECDSEACDDRATIVRESLWSCGEHGGRVKERLGT
jgi:hypothetical protein